VGERGGGMAKYPKASDLYESLLYPGRSCEVVTVENARVTFRWLGEYAHIEPQVVPVNRFVTDFVVRERTVARS
jgi:hypothetical protein